MKKNVITISRETGSGGHTVGMMLAKKLGYQFYDGEIMESLAKELGVDGMLDDEHMDSEDEFNMLAGYVPFKPLKRKQKVNFEEINRLQQNMIKKLAKDGNCVIVGRNSDAVLKDSNNCFHIFIHADMEHRVKRVLEHEIEEHNKSGKNRSNSGLNNGDSEIMYSGNAKAAVDKAGESADEARIRHELELKDKTRGANYEYFTGRSWGSVGNYNLVIDTSIISEQDACEIILDILNRVNGGEKDA